MSLLSAARRLQLSPICSQLRPKSLEASQLSNTMFSNTARRRPSEISDGVLVECESSSLSSYTKDLSSIIGRCVEAGDMYFPPIDAFQGIEALIRRNINGMSVSCLYESCLLEFRNGSVCGGKIR